MTENLNVTTKKTINRGKRSRTGFIIAMMAWPVVHWFVFYFILNVQSIIMAFQVRDIKTNELVLSFGNFTRLFREGFTGTQPVLAEGVKNTLTFFFFSTLVLFPINLINGYFFYKKIPGYKVFRFVFYLPAIIPGLVLATLFKYIISPESSGLLSVILSNFNVRLPDLLGSSQYAMKTMLVYNFWTGMTGFLLTCNAMARIPHEILESAQLDGIKPMQELVLMLVPLVWPTISVSLLLSVVGIFTSSGPVLIFTKGAYGTYTVSYWMFERVLNTSNLEYAAAAGLFFTLLGLPILVIARWLTNRVEAVEY